MSDELLEIIDSLPENERDAFLERLLALPAFKDIFSKAQLIENAIQEQIDEIYDMEDEEFFEKYFELFGESLDLKSDIAIRRCNEYYEDEDRHYEYLCEELKEAMADGDIEREMEIREKLGNIYD